MPFFNKPKKVTTASQQATLPTRRSKRSWPKVNIDLNRPADRGKVALSALGLLVVLIVIGAAGIQGYVYMESTEFCGTLCHSMGPQFTQHNISAHVNVECVSCHIGPGVEHFVRSKINGARQLFLTLNHSYNLPIKGPVKDLRPARETCETCHNPQSFKDNLIKSIIHYDSDEANTKLQTTLVLKMGGTQTGSGFSQGIHWHISSKIYYIPVDEQRQIIAWIGVEQKDGSLKEYFSRDMLNMDRKAFVDKARADDQVRLMDCIDCHNRTAHYIPTPEEAVDNALSLNRLSTDLPFIRSKVVDLLRQKYPSTGEANTAIDALGAFYQKNYPGAVAGKLDATVTELKSLYGDTSFPEMKAYWDTNPNFEHHAGSSGCFRCHDGKHVTEDATGKVVGTISAECNTCHSVPITSRGDEIGVNLPLSAGASLPRIMTSGGRSNIDLPPKCKSRSAISVMARSHATTAYAMAFHIHRTCSTRTRLNSRRAARWLVTCAIRMCCAAGATRLLRQMAIPASLQALSTPRIQARLQAVVSAFKRARLHLPAQAQGSKCDDGKRSFKNECQATH